MIEVADIADKLAPMALDLCEELLPNGFRDGQVWRCSGISDHGGSTSMWVDLSGSRQGRWRDAGNCPSDEKMGDLVDLIRLRLCGGDMRAAVQEAKRRLGIEDAPSANGRPAMTDAERARRAEEAAERRRQREKQLAEERESKMKNARALYLAHASVPIARTPADFYLRNRGLTPDPLPAWPGCLRFHPEAYCKPIGAKAPAMLAPVYRADGCHVATHRTYLRNDPARGWVKIDSPNAKMVLGPMGGGFIPINKGASGKPMSAMPEGEPVYMTEGIEDGVVLRMAKPEARIVAGISLGNIGAIVFPENVGQLILAADRDDNPQAIETLERSIAQQQARGVLVQLVFPPAEFKDLNDWLRGVRKGEA